MATYEDMKQAAGAGEHEDAPQGGVDATQQLQDVLSRLPPEVLKQLPQILQQMGIDPKILQDPEAFLELFGNQKFQEALAAALQENGAEQQPKDDTAGRMRTAIQAHHGAE